MRTYPSGIVPLQLLLQAEKTLSKCHQAIENVGQAPPRTKLPPSPLRYLLRRESPNLQTF
jgi:hypothetical protein